MKKPGISAATATVSNTLIFLECASADDSGMKRSRPQT